ncbi:DUF4177 domain-containing protein [Clostridium sp. D2Q-11]|uniref:DUF4177 domain-containing protein n=1 Tax=Anaeromonas frigoriresistens TaxID=2683708 RepID=A0A942UPV9_9FIRM|nr:DUF4177 domain-containing protein [Anaeromonas frigoriresistens]MBS4537003.1 DUF4177 domain-containing protein [Anaeromonas frigoriresistens]
MYEYKVFKWNLSTLTLTEELENILNDYGKEGWRIFDIKFGNRTVFFTNPNKNETTIILERVKEN